MQLWQRTAIPSPSEMNVVKFELRPIHRPEVEQPAPPPGQSPREAVPNGHECCTPSATSTGGRQCNLGLLPSAGATNSFNLQHPPHSSTALSHTVSSTSASNRGGILADCIAAANSFISAGVRGAPKTPFSIGHAARQSSPSPSSQSPSRHWCGEDRIHLPPAMLRQAHRLGLREWQGWRYHLRSSPPRITAQRFLPTGAALRNVVDTDSLSANDHRVAAARSSSRRSNCGHIPQAMTLCAVAAVS